MEQFTGSRRFDYEILRDILRSRIITKKEFDTELAKLKRKQAGIDKRSAIAAAKREAKRQAAKAKREFNKKPIIIEVEIRMPYEHKDDDKKRKRVKIVDKSIKTTEGRKEKAVKDALDRAVAEFEEESNVAVQEGSTAKITATHAVTSGSNLSAVKMKRTGALKLDGEEHYEFDKKQGTCVIDFLEWRYGSIKGCKKMANRENLIEFFGKDCVEEGISTIELVNFAQRNNIALYALDECNNIFHHFTPDKRNTNLPPIAYRVKNNHFYPLIEAVKQIAAIVSTQLAQSKAKEKKEVVEKELPVVVVESINPFKTLIDMCKTKGTEVFDKVRPPIEFDSDGLVSFVLEDVKYQFDRGVFTEQAKAFAEINGKEYNGMSIHIILRSIVNQFPELKTRSILNPQCAKVFGECKNRTHYGMVAPLTCDAWACDIAKCYSFCIANPVSKWFQFGISDEWEPYKGKLISGFYFVETNDLTLLHGSSIYSNAIIQLAIEEGIELTIKYQLIPSKVLPTDYYKPLLNKIDEECKGDPKIKKSLTNIFVGTLGKTKSKRYTARLDTDANTVWREYNKDTEGEFFVHQREDYYIYGRRTEYELSETNVPQYYQILDQSNILLYKMIKASGGKLLGRKTDCAVISGGSLEFGEVMGSYRPCDIPKLTEADSAEDRSVQSYICENENWKIYNVESSSQIDMTLNILKETSGILITGRAGTGKSYLVQEISKQFSKVAKMAFTNKAALNIGGTTIHKFLKIDQHGKACLWALKKKYQKGEDLLIIIDEISMISGDIWRLLAEVKKTLPKAVFILAGDYRQLPPIEEKPIDWFNSSIVKYIACHNRIDLIVKQRYAQDLWDAAESLDKSDFQHGSPLDAKHICYLNSTRKRLNALLNDKQGIFVPCDDEEQSQDVYLYPNLPIIGCRNYQNKDGLAVCNSESFIIKSVNKKEVVAQSQRPEGVHTFTFLTNNFHKYFVLNFASTTHKSQGDTINSKIVIWDWERMDRKCRYTAVTRAKELNQIFIA